MHGKSSLKLIQLIGQPDEKQEDMGRPYRDLMTSHGIKEISAYAFAVSPDKNVIVPRNATTGYVDESGIQHGALVSLSLSLSVFTTLFLPLSVFTTLFLPLSPLLSLPLFRWEK